MPDALSPSRSRLGAAAAYRHGIGGRLIGAQMLLVILAVSGFALAIISFGQLRHVLSVMIDQRVPVMTAAMTLARDSERLNVSAPALAAATTDQTRERQFQDIRRQLQALDASLQVLRQSDLDRSSVDGVAMAVRKLGDNLGRINGLVADSLQAEQSEQALSGALIKARDAILAEIEPAISNTAMRISLDGKDVNIHPSKELLDDLANALALNRPMLVVQSQIQAAVDALSDMAKATAKDGVRQQALKSRGALKEARGALKELPATLAGHIQGPYDDILRIGSVKEGIPALQSRRIELRDKSDSIIAEDEKLTEDMVSNIRRLTDRAGDDIRTSSAGAHSLLGTRIWVLIAVGVLTVVFSLMIAFLFVGRRVVEPLVDLVEIIRKLAAGDMSVAIVDDGRRDEIGEISRAIAVFKDNALAVDRLRREQEDAKSRTEADRLAAMRKMADDFEESVGKVVQAVTSAAGQLEASSGRMADTARDSSAKITTVASAAQEASVNVHTVASASGQVASSINEISRHVERSREVAHRAGDEAQHTTMQMRALSENVDKIGEIVQLINSIAAQTNLLALNATIEAARAGDAGKGFAVVAGEVKNLANQTAHATSEIAGQIHAVQEGTTVAVRAIDSISGVIGEMAEISASVAAAVQQQSAATDEIAGNIDQVAAGTREVSANITAVDQAARETGTAAEHIRLASSDLSNQAGILRGEVARFLRQVRSDAGGR